jgi:hypothetical protein
VRKRQVEVARVRVVQKVSYAEAMKKVEGDGSRVRDPERIPVSSRFVPASRDRPTSDSCFSKVGSQKIGVAVAAAENYLGI